MVFCVRTLGEEIRSRGHANALSVPTSHFWGSLEITTRCSTSAIIISIASETQKDSNDSKE